MSSSRRIAASRANGARSHGPKTPEGKARSSKNAITHGLLARTVLIGTESEEGLRDTVDAYLERFPNPDPVAFTLIQELAALYWRTRRIWAIENHCIDQLIQAQPADAPGIA